MMTTKNNSGDNDNSDDNDSLDTMMVRMMVMNGNEDNGWCDNKRRRCDDERQWTAYQ